MQSLYGTAERTVIAGERGKLTLIGGFHQLNWRQKVKQGLTAVYHEDMTDSTLPYGASQYAFFVPGYAQSTRTVVDDTLSIDSTESVSYHPWGVALGASGSWSLTDRLSLSGSILQSYLWGKARFSGTVSDVEQRTETTIETVYGSEGPSETVTAEDDSQERLFDLPETSLEQDTSVTEAHAGLQFDFTDSLFATLGYAWTRWNGLPTAPQWRYDSPTTGTWESGDTADVGYSRWTLGLGVRF
jgi:opacity protein-like surface antigen